MQLNYLSQLSRKLNSMGTNLNKKSIIRTPIQLNMLDVIYFRL